MGIFKDLATLSRQGRQATDRMDVSAMLADAQSSMASMTAAMTALAERSTETVIVGATPAVATITGVRSTGQLVNFHPMLQLDLLVPMHGMLTPVTVTEIVLQQYLHLAVPGCRLNVRIGRTPDALMIDWSTPIPATAA